MTKISAYQRAMLRELKAWSEPGPDSEDVVGCHGAAFWAVLDAVERKGLAVRTEFDGNLFWSLTDAGHAAIAKRADVS